MNNPQSKLRLIRQAIQHSIKPEINSATKAALISVLVWLINAELLKLAEFIIITVIRLILSITKTINCWSNFKIKIILKINNEITGSFAAIIHKSTSKNVLAQWIAWLI